MLNRQEIFNIVITHLLKQEYKSKSSRVNKGEAMKAYHGIRGRKSALGVLISRSAYLEEMEGKPINEVFDLYGDRFTDICCDYITVELIKNLEFLHDNYLLDKANIKCKWKVQFKHNARKIASYYGLTMPEIK